MVIFALIGNDGTSRTAAIHCGCSSRIRLHVSLFASVCNGHNGTSHMTPPKEFYEAVTDSLQYLDTKLPSGSTVLIVALVDGRILWNIMHSKSSLLPHLDT